MVQTYDAIIVGAGHNGLVAALYLARAGWKTLVLERNEQIGGAVMSGEVTLPGFIHDLYSTNQNLFLSSPVYQELRADLERHGLHYCTSPQPYCNVFPDGSSLRVYQNADKTMDLLQAHNPDDVAGWKDLYAHFQTFVNSLLPLYGTPLVSTQALRLLIQAWRSVGISELLRLARIILSSTRELGDNYFASPEVKALIACWGMHLDFGPDVSGGAMFPFLETFADAQAGMSIVQGGASRMVEALAGLLREYGGEVRMISPVRRIVTTADKATGVVLESGEQIEARHAVIANTTPTALFNELLAGYPFSPTLQRQVQRYTYGPGTMMIHLALKGRPQWRAGEDVSQFAYVHIAPYVDDLARTYTDALAGLLPASPLLIVGQTSAVDPSRAPEGQHVLWIQVRALPSRILGDAAGEIKATDWDAVKETYADRVLRKLADYAPGIQDLILARTVHSPADLARSNPNLVGGDSLAGSHHLHQNFVFRPLLGWSNYRMPLKGLYMVGAATWPGAGTNAISGYLAAQKILNNGRPGSSLIRIGLAAAVAVAIGVGIIRAFSTKRE